MPMRPAPTYGHRLRGTGLAALCTLLAACGQTGYLYLVMPPAKLPPLTAEPAPAPSTSSIPVAPCVMMPAANSNVAPMAAPFAGTSLAGVPYAPGTIPSEAAPASVTDILPACATFSAHHLPEDHKHE